MSRPGDVPVSRCDLCGWEEREVSPERLASDHGWRFGYLAPLADRYADLCLRCWWSFSDARAIQEAEDDLENAIRPTTAHKEFTDASR